MSILVGWCFLYYIYIGIYLGYDRSSSKTTTHHYSQVKVVYSLTIFTLNVLLLPFSWCIQVKSLGMGKFFFFLWFQMTSLLPRRFCFLIESGKLDLYVQTISYVWNNAQSLLGPIQPYTVIPRLLETN